MNCWFWKLKELNQKVICEQAGVHVGGSGVRPLSTIDSGLYSTDSTDSDQEQDKSKEQGKHKDRIFIVQLLASPILKPTKL